MESKNGNLRGMNKLNTHPTFEKVAELIYTLFFIRNLPQGLVLKVPYL